MREYYATTKSNVQTAKVFLTYSVLSIVIFSVVSIIILYVFDKVIFEYYINNYSNVSYLFPFVQAIVLVRIISTIFVNLLLIIEERIRIIVGQILATIVTFTVLVLNSQNILIYSPC